MGRVVFGRGDAAVELSDDLSALVTRSLRAASAGASDLLEAEGDPILRAAIAGWPRRSGYSAGRFKGGLRVRKDAGGTVVEYFIRNDASYIFYVMSGGFSRRTRNKRYERTGHQWTAWVRRPMDQAAERIALRLPAETVRRLTEAA